MKNLTIIFTAVLLVLIHVGCKKDKNTDEEDIKMDLTGYYIPCKTTYNIAGKRFQMASAYHFKPLAQGSLFYPGGYETFEYQFKDDRLSITTGEVSWHMQNEMLSDFTSRNPNFLTTDYRLVKAPETNAFENKRFDVSPAAISVDHQNGNSSDVPIGEFSGLRFSKDKFFMRRTGGETEMGSYTLQNNGIATARTGAAGTLWLFVFNDDVLYFSCVYQDKTQYGTLGIPF